MTAWKYNLDMNGVQDIDIVKGGKILCVANQGKKKAVIYIFVDQDETAREKIRVFIAGTGHPRDDIAETKYIGTLLFFGGAEVYHFFVEPKAKLFTESEKNGVDE